MDSFSSPVCALCREPFEAQGDSKEHVIPNSLGGRKKVKGFICRGCNSKSGESWDAEIWRQFSQIAMIHGVTRDRGTAPNILIETVDGSSYWLLPDGSMTLQHPIYETEATEGGQRLHITARHTEEAERMVRQIAKKNPSVDVESMLGAMREVETPLESPVTVTAQFGGELAGRSIVKSAVAMAVSAGVSASACGQAIAFLRGEAVPPPHAGFFLRDLILARPSDHTINCVSVSGDPHTRRLLGYIEYFSVWREVVVLSETYDGPSMQATYAFDPASGRELDLDVDLALKESEVAAVWANEAMSDSGLSSAAHAGFALVQKRDQQRHQTREINRAFERTCESMGIPRGSDVPKERAEEFAARMAEYLGPLIRSMIRR